MHDQHPYVSAAAAAVFLLLRCDTRCAMLPPFAAAYINSMLLVSNHHKHM